MPWWLVAMLSGGAVAVAAELWWRSAHASTRSRAARRESELEAMREANRRPPDGEHSE